MTKSNKVLIVVGFVAVLVVGFILGSLGAHQSAPVQPVLGATVYDQSNLVGDVTNGLQGTLMMSKGLFVGPINSTASSTFSSTTTFAGRRISTNSIASSSAASATLLASSLSCGGSLVLTLPTSSVSLTLPASSTLSTLVPLSAGSRCGIVILNASTTAGENVTIVEGTGWNLGSTTNPVIGPDNAGLLEIIRKPNTDLVGILLHGTSI